MLDFVQVSIRAEKAINKLRAKKLALEQKLKDAEWSDDDFDTSLSYAGAYAAAIAASITSAEKSVIRENIKEIDGDIILLKMVFAKTIDEEFILTCEKKIGEIIGKINAEIAMLNSEKEKVEPLLETVRRMKSLLGIE